MSGLRAAGVIALAAALSASYSGLLVGGKPQPVRHEQLAPDSPGPGGSGAEEDQDPLTAEQAAAILRRLSEEAGRPEQVARLEEAKRFHADGTSLGSQVSSFFQDEGRGFVQWLSSLPEESWLRPGTPSGRPPGRGERVVRAPRADEEEEEERGEDALRDEGDETHPEASPRGPDAHDDLVGSLAPSELTRVAVERGVMPDATVRALLSKRPHGAERNDPAALTDSTLEDNLSDEDDTIVEDLAGAEKQVSTDASYRAQLSKHLRALINSAFEDGFSDEDDETHPEALQRGLDARDDLEGSLAPSELTRVAAERGVPGLSSMGGAMGGAMGGLSKMGGGATGGAMGGAMGGGGLKVPGMGGKGGGALGGLGKLAGGGGKGGALGGLGKLGGGGGGGGKGGALGGLGKLAGGKGKGLGGMMGGATNAMDTCDDKDCRETKKQQKAFKKLLKKAQKNMEIRLEKAKNDSWEVRDVYKVWERYNQTFDCVNGKADPQYHWEKMLAFWQRYRKKNDTTWMTVADHYFKDYVEAAANITEKVQNDLLTGKHLRRIKWMVKGQTENLTDDEWRDAGWIDPVAEKTYAMFVEEIEKPGWEPLWCIKRFMLGDIYNKLWLLRRPWAKTLMHSIFRHWDLLVPQAMKWIVKRMMQFLSEFPQEIRMSARTVNTFAVRCLARWRNNQFRVQEYAKLFHSGKADKDKDWVPTLHVIRETFFPPGMYGITYGTPDHQEEGKPIDWSEVNAVDPMGEVYIKGVSTLAKSGGGTLREFVQLIWPPLMNVGVAPVTAVMRDLVRSLAHSQLPFLDGTLSIFPYIGTISSALITQAMSVSATFMVARLEELLINSVNEFFGRVLNKSSWIAGIVVREFSEAEVSHLSMQTHEWYGEQGVKSGMENVNARALGTDQVVNAIYSTLKAHPYLKELEPIVPFVMAMVREAYPNLHAIIASCDSASLMLSDIVQLAGKPLD